MKYLIYTLIFTGLGLNSITSTASNERYLVDLLKEDLQPLVKTLNKDMYSYHWYISDQDWENHEKAKKAKAKGRKFKAKRVKLNAKKIANHFLRTAADFWHLPTEYKDDYVGAGVYSATTSQVSQHYGLSALEIKAPAGMKYIDMRTTGHRFRYRSFDLDKSYEALDEVCKFNNPSPHAKLKNEGNTRRATKADLFRNKACHKIFTTAVYELGVQFLAYRWNPPYKHLVYLKECNEKFLTAFVFFGKLNKLENLKYTAKFVNGKNNNSPVTTGELELKAFNGASNLAPPRKELEDYRLVDRLTRYTLKTNGATSHTKKHHTKGKWDIFADEPITSDDIELMKDRHFECLK